MRISKLMRPLLLNYFRKVPITMSSNMKMKTTLTLGVSGYLLWMSNQKISKEEQFQVFETDDNLNEGQLKQIQVGPKVEDTVMVVKYEGKVYCIQSKCAHFGFSLAKGLLMGDKILCPLHNAGFSIKTGQPDQGPVFDGLKTFPVEVVNGKIKVTIPKIGWDSSPQRKPIENIDNSKRIVIIGGGPASQSAVDTLRDTGYKGQIYIVSRENLGPYDRTMLSKVMDASKVPSEIRSPDFMRKNGVIFIPDSNVVGIDYSKKQVQLQSKEPIKYDKLLIASGCVNRVPPIAGLDKTKYSTLRNIRDYKQINEDIRKPGIKNVTIIGGGFIGIEVASAIKLALKEDINVTIIQQAKTPLEHVLGEQVGTVMKNLCVKNNINIITSAKVKQIKGDQSKAKEVVLEGQTVPTDVLVMATGVKCSVQFASNLVDKENMGIKTNVYLQTDKKDVYAAGDVASYPYWYTGNRSRIEHYNEAIYQGSVAAMNMNGKKFPMDNIPFFWTRSFNNTLSFTGITAGWDDVYIKGSLQQLKFVAYYIRKKDQKILGAAVMGIPNQIQIINEAMRNGVMPDATRIRNPSFKLQELVKETRQKNPKCTRCSACQHE